MATGKALICKLGKHIEIPGADRIVQVDMFGETIITQKSNVEGTVGLLFDMETCLTHEYASKNNMYRHSDLNENKKIVGYLEDDRRIRPVRLKGVKCSALFMPIRSLDNSIREDNMNYHNLRIGEEIDTTLGVKICEKYISKATKNSISNKQGKIKQNLVPTFKEHIDTDQWSRNTHKVQEGDLVIITEKLHGTSGRCGYLKVSTPASKWERFIANYITSPLTLGRIGKFKEWHNYKFVVGSRRVVKSISGNEVENKAHFYEEDLWTKVSKTNFEGKLYKGESIYFEIVGYTPSGELIMPSVSNNKLEKFLSKEEYKEFINRYGETTTFNYGCTREVTSFDTATATYNQEPIFNMVYVYRITMTNEDGDSIDLSWEQVKTRCEKLGVNHVPELDKILTTEITIGNKVEYGDGHTMEHLSTIVERRTNEASKDFPNHIREGVCVRIENGNNTPLILKEKSYIFKVLEGIIKDSDVVDIEESN